MPFPRPPTDFPESARALLAGELRGELGVVRLIVAGQREGAARAPATAAASGGAAAAVRSAAGVPGCACAAAGVPACTAGLAGAGRAAGAGRTAGAGRCRRSRSCRPRRSFRRSRSCRPSSSRRPSPCRTARAGGPTGAGRAARRLVAAGAGRTARAGRAAARRASAGARDAVVVVGGATGHDQRDAQRSHCSPEKGGSLHVVCTPVEAQKAQGRGFRAAPALTEPLAEWANVLSMMGKRTPRTFTKSAGWRPAQRGSANRTPSFRRRLERSSPDRDQTPVWPIRRSSSTSTTRARASRRSGSPIPLVDVDQVLVGPRPANLAEDLDRFRGPRNREADRSPSLRR